MKTVPEWFILDMRRLQELLEEEGTDLVNYAVYATVQQGDENIHFYAHNAERLDVLLGRLEIFKHMILDHHEEQVPKSLEEYPKEDDLGITLIPDIDSKLKH